VIDDSQRDKGKMSGFGNFVGAQLRRHRAEQAKAALERQAGDNIAWARSKARGSAAVLSVRREKHVGKELLSFLYEPRIDLKLVVIEQRTTAVLAVDVWTLFENSISVEVLGWFKDDKTASIRID
jgi:hypothetical protein